MDIGGLSSDDLHQRINDTLLQGQRRCIKLLGSSRKVSSVNAYALMCRDIAKQQLNAYVDKLSECLLDFRSQMLETIIMSMKTKQERLTELQNKYMDDNRTLHMLIAETEDLVKFGKSLDDPANREKARSLLEAFGSFLQRHPEDCFDKDCYNFDVRTRFKLRDITPGMFGYFASDSSEQMMKQQYTDMSGHLIEQGNRCTNIPTQDVSTQTSCEENNGHIYNVTVAPPPGFTVFGSASSMSVINCSPTSQTRASIPAFHQYRTRSRSQTVDDINNNNAMPVLQENTHVHDKGRRDGYENTCAKQTSEPPARCPPRYNQKDLGSSSQSISIDTPGNTDLMDISLPNLGNCEGGHGDVQGTQTRRSHDSGDGRVNNTTSVPNIVKNLLKKRLSCDRKPLRRPFTVHTKKNSFQQHSTPIKMEIDDEEDVVIVESSVNRDAEVLGDIQTRMESTERNTSIIESTENWDDELLDNVQSDNSQNDAACDLGAVTTHVTTQKKGQELPDKTATAMTANDYCVLDNNDGATDRNNPDQDRGAELKMAENHRTTVRQHLGAEALTTEQRNKLILQSQTKWCKGYLSRTFASQTTKAGKLKRKNTVIESTENWDDELLDNLKSEKNDVEQLDLKPSSLEVINGDISNRLNASFQSGTEWDGSSVSVDDSCTVTTQKTEQEACVKTELLDDNKNMYSNNHEDGGGIGVTGINKQDQDRSAEPRETQIVTERKTSRVGVLREHWLSTCHWQRRNGDLDAEFEFEVCGNLHYPIGLTTNSTGHLLVADTGNHVVKKFDGAGHLICEIGKAEDMRRPSAIVVNKHDEMFVKDDICIRQFDKHGSYIKDIGKSFFKKSFGLAMTSSKQLLVLETHYSNPSLVHVSQNGRMVGQYLYTPLINPHPRSKCRFLGVSDNNVIVSDLGMSEVYITTLEGLFLTKLGTYGNGLMQFVEPSGIAVDNYGNVLIGDSKNNRIQIYRSDGSYVGLLSLDKPIVRPSGLHLTADNKLMVVNFLHHHVKIFQL